MLNFKRRTWGQSLLFVAIPSIIAALMTTLYKETSSLRWIGISDTQQIFSSETEVAIWFVVLLFSYSIGNVLFRQLKANVLINSFVVSMVTYFSGLVLNAIAFGNIWSGSTSVSPVYILVISTFIIQVFCMRIIPLKNYSDTLDATLAACSFFLLIIFFLPWHNWQLKRMSDEQRETKASKTFGTTYLVARKTMLNCATFLDYVGPLSRFVISSRRNKVGGNGLYFQGFYDFDYVGERSKGRVTILLTHLLPIEENGKTTREESWVGYNEGPMADIRIYPDYQERSLLLKCVISR